MIDIGTNTLLLLVAEQCPGVSGRPGLRAIREEQRFGRLGKGLDQTGVLDSGAIGRSLDILREYRAIIDELGVAAVRVVGTQALREARNAADFVIPGETILGVSIEVIAGEREALLVHRAVAEWFPDLAGETYVIADVGGGSTEVIVVSPAGLESFVSVPIGSVRLTERYLHADPPTTEQVTNLISGIDRALAGLSLPQGACLVGSAGTATTIASVERRLRQYDPALVQGFSLPRHAVERQLARYLELTLAERRRLVGLEPERADVIAAGVAIFTRLLDRLAAPRFIVNERGVRWGVAHEQLEQSSDSAINS